MRMPTNQPISLNILRNKGFIPDRYDNHIVRRLSDMQGQFLDQKAYQSLLDKEDSVLYEVYEISATEAVGELIPGISIVHPGKVGNEYYMTKGHFHTIIDTAELYYCLQGGGYILMETPEGEFKVESIKPETVVYIPPQWAHRSVNCSPDDTLVTLFVYPANAGHDYRSIEKQGFRRLVIEEKGSPRIIDNPRWLPPEKR